MTQQYYVSKQAQADGYHEVHADKCNVLPYPENRISLGTHTSRYTAVAKARDHYSKVDGCKFCSPSCHTR